MHQIDVEAIRHDFPILSRTVRGRPLVYLDNAATTQKPRQVIAALKTFYEQHYANIHRGVHALAEESTDKYEATREHVARFIHVPGHDGAQVIFTRNATESINLIAYGWGRKFLKAGDEIILTVMEHHANMIPWFEVAKVTGAKLKFIDIDDQGLLRLDQFKQALTARTRLVAITHVSNVLGTINPITQIAQLAHARGALVAIDGAQAAPHLAVDVRALDCDFYVFSAHKMLGPTGVGVLYARRAALEVMDPFNTGGEMISKVTLEGATWNELPWKFEAGTPNIAGVAAFDAALTYLERMGMDAVRSHEQQLTRYALEHLSALPDVTIYGPWDVAQRTGAVAFNLGTIHPHDVGTVLDRQGVAIRAGHHCAQPLMKRLGVMATARASLYLYNTMGEIDALCHALTETAQFFAPKTKAAARQ